MANATRQADLSLPVGRLHESIRQAGPPRRSPRFCTLTPAAVNLCHFVVELVRPRIGCCPWVFAPPAPTLQLCGRLSLTFRAVFDYAVIIALGCKIRRDVPGRSLL